MYPAWECKERLMSTISVPYLRSSALGFAMALLVPAGMAVAQSAPTSAPQTSTPAQQTTTTSQDGWKRFNGGWSSPPASTPAPNAKAAPAPTTATEAVPAAAGADPDAQDAQGAQSTPPADQQSAPTNPAANGSVNAPANLPPSSAPAGDLTIPSGTYLTVRLNQALSSDRNQKGDAFTATLAQPVIVNGIVVAQRGQVVGGRVVEAKKAGMVSGVSHLGLELNGLTLADGQNVPIQSQLITWNGPTSKGRDAAAIAGTTGFGAAVGAAADWGTGAAIGAGAGAAAGVIGVLLTRGRPTILYPETQLTFQVTAPVAVDTQNAPQAFHAAAQSDYQQSTATYNSETPGPACGPYGCPPPYPYAYPYPYYAYYGPYYGYPYYWGPGFGFYFGPGFYGRGFYGRGFYGRGFRR